MFGLNSSGPIPNSSRQVLLIRRPIYLHSPGIVTFKKHISDCSKWIYAHLCQLWNQSLVLHPVLKHSESEPKYKGSWNLSNFWMCFWIHIQDILVLAFPSIIMSSRRCVQYDNSCIRKESLLFH